MNDIKRSNRAKARHKAMLLRRNQLVPFNKSKHNITTQQFRDWLDTFLLPVVINTNDNPISLDIEHVN